MKLQVDIGLARPPEVRRIALMSRDAIEAGLAWSWTPGRVMRAMADAATNVIVARDGSDPAALAAPAPIGFAIMSYGEQEAHLQLFAVVPQRRRMGVGSALLAWLEATARTAGIGVIRLETRASNSGGHAFYRAHGYVEVDRLSGYYQGAEDALRFARDLQA